MSTLSQKKKKRKESNGETPETKNVGETPKKTPKFETKKKRLCEVERKTARDKEGKKDRFEGHLLFQSHQY